LDSFKATLEETAGRPAAACRDCANPSIASRSTTVNAVLEEIGASSVPQLLVYNQIDRVPGMQPEIVRDTHGKILNIKVSAYTEPGSRRFAKRSPQTRDASRRLPPP
jgi:GTP-binding protein HflX